jgi:hypothetical protein
MALADGFVESELEDPEAECGADDEADEDAA